MSLETKIEALEKRVDEMLSRFVKPVEEMNVGELEDGLRSTFSDILRITGGGEPTDEEVDDFFKYLMSLSHQQREELFGLR